MTTAAVQDQIWSAWFIPGLAVPGGAPWTTSFIDADGNPVTVTGQVWDGVYTAALTAADGTVTQLGPYATAALAVAGIATALGAN